MYLLFERNVYSRRVVDYDWQVRERHSGAAALVGLLSAKKIRKCDRELDSSTTHRQLWHT
jgi:hypothetical protein